MKIVNFDKHHIPQALALALANYEEEREAVPALPRLTHTPDLTRFLSTGLGVAAEEDGRLLGFLCCFKPWDGAFGCAARGTFSPIHAHGAVKENRERIYRRLYQAAAEKWVAAGIGYHAIALYAHDEQALKAFFLYGFGIRCSDAVRDLYTVQTQVVDGIRMRRLAKDEVGCIRELRVSLNAHLKKSPCFVDFGAASFQRWLEMAENRDSQVFVAEVEEAVAAFLEVGADGENFVTEHPAMLNICGAYCLPQYRGKGVFSNLLGYAVEQLKQQGTLLLGVDYETWNPTALGAWEKHFTAYTRSVVRRIDDGALKGE